MVDKQRVVANGPRSFDNQLLALVEFDGSLRANTGKNMDDSHMWKEMPGVTEIDNWEENNWEPIVENLNKKGIYTMKKQEARMEEGNRVTAHGWKRKAREHKGVVGSPQTCSGDKRRGDAVCNNQEDKADKQDKLKKSKLSHDLPGMFSELETAGAAPQPRRMP
ncbi:hypothetical protein U1Q18_028477 [Sarracenia purpurea var. burkii]